MEFGLGCTEKAQVREGGMEQVTHCDRVTSNEGVQTNRATDVRATTGLGWNQGRNYDLFSGVFRMEATRCEGPMRDSVLGEGQRAPAPPAKG